LSLARQADRLAPALVLLAVAGLVIAGYLLAVRLAGGLPVCPVSGGCEAVQQSEYSAIAGIPVAAIGVGYSVVLLGATVAWWRTRDRRALYLAYGLGLLACLMVGYLTYLELFVIHAVCTWCAAYGASVVIGWALAVVALRRAGTR
jgi:uncharacterized membrane protein